jgi:hypothetical protein
MSASPQAGLLAFLVASLLLSANVARASMARPDVRWAVLTGAACASLAAVHASMGW